jgi:hypothetical protein
VSGKIGTIFFAGRLSVPENFKLLQYDFYFLSREIIRRDGVGSSDVVVGSYLC